MLIAQSQLELMRRQVERSEQAVVVADADGRILLTSQAFEALLPAGHPRLANLEDLPQLFQSSLKVRRRLRELVEPPADLARGGGLLDGRERPRPVLVRADPVFSAPGRVLGFIAIVTDMVERKAADAARRRFQESVVARSRMTTARLESKSDLLQQNLLSSIVETPSSRRSRSPTASTSAECQPCSTASELRGPVSRAAAPRDSARHGCDESLNGSSPAVPRPLPRGRREPIFANSLRAAPRRRVQRLVTRQHADEIRDAPRACLGLLRLVHAIEDRVPVVAVEGREERERLGVGLEGTLQIGYQGTPLQPAALTDEARAGRIAALTGTAAVVLP